ncbi:MAG: hypothetical protein BWK79_11790 [Beggiatoa sp. IS2]|nr:MAG: hypothetical protein BWK79_11790 [Beggiatoa sp. IS2]
MSTEQSTVFIVDDDEEVCKSLCWLLQSVSLQTRCYSSAQDFLNYYCAHQSGCLLLDVRLPIISGLDLHKRLVAQNISLPVIILTGYGDVSMAVGAMKTGAFDFIEKPYNDQILIDRVQQAIKYDARLRRDQVESQLLLTRLTQLTPRELEVMKQLVEGKANKVIARELGITYKTVEVHRARIMEKTQANSIVELVHIALVCGILPRIEDYHY